MPKAVRRKRVSLAADAAMLAAMFRDTFVTDSVPVFLSTVSAEHLYGTLWADLLPRVLGAECHADQVNSWESLLDAQRRYAAVVFVTTPSFLAELVARRESFVPIRNLRAVVTSGSLLRPEVSRAAEELFGVCPLEIYGSTETGSVAWRRQCDGEAWTLFEGVYAEVTPEGFLQVDSPFAVERPFVLHDAVRFYGDASDRFVLHGRADRQVKILEHRVVLPDIENFFRKHSAVADCAAVASEEAVPRLWLTVVPSEAGRAVLFQEGYGGLTRALRAYATASLPGYCIPRRIRFVRALPYTDRGKLPRSVLLEAFAVRRQPPVTECFEVRGETLHAEFFFPSDAIFFSGHFPGFPILPGVAQLFTVRAMVAEAFGCAPDGSIRRLKFQQPISPCQRVALDVERVSPGGFDFWLSSDGEPCASGRLLAAEGGAYGV